MLEIDENNWLTDEDLQAEFDRSDSLDELLTSLRLRHAHFIQKQIEKTDISHIHSSITF